MVTVQYTYITKGNGVEFFPDIEPDTAKIYIHARGNLSTEEKAELVYDIEKEVLNINKILLLPLQENKKLYLSLNNSEYLKIFII